MSQSLRARARLRTRDPRERAQRPWEPATRSARARFSLDPRQAEEDVADDLIPFDRDEGRDECAGLAERVRQTRFGVCFERSPIDGMNCRPVSGILRANDHDRLLSSPNE